MHLFGLILAAALFAPLPAAALCVTNGTGDKLYFTVASQQDDLRIGANLGPGQELCLAGSRSGVVAAFESDTSIEGCSRLAEDADRLQVFARFDRCTWASHLTESGTSGD